MVDFINIFLLESTKRWIPLVYFCSNQQKVDSIICFYWSQQNHKFILIVTTVFPRGWLGVFISLLKVNINKIGYKRDCEWLEFEDLLYHLCPIWNCIKIARSCAHTRISVHLYRNSKCKSWTGFKSQKCMCNTHNSNNDKTDQENNNTAVLKWWCLWILDRGREGGATMWFEAWIDQRVNKLRV